MSKRRIVVTGLGIVSPIGNKIEQAWQALLAGTSGIRLIQGFDTSEFSTRFAGQVLDFDVTQYLSPKEARKCDTFVQYGVAAACDAVVDSGLDKFEGLNKDRVGVAMGSGIGGIGTIESNHRLLMESGPRRISPFFIPASIINMASGHVSILYNFRGPNLAFATACTTGTHSIGLAARCIAYGDADVMVAGGAEYASTPLGLGGFAAVRALSTFNEAPDKASRPGQSPRRFCIRGWSRGTGLRRI